MTLCFGIIRRRSVDRDYFDFSFDYFQKDPYFPQGVMNLRYTISCDVWNERGLRLRANDRTITLSADSSHSRDEWVKAIRKVYWTASRIAGIFMIESGHLQGPEHGGEC